MKKLVLSVFCMVIFVALMVSSQAFAWEKMDIRTGEITRPGNTFDMYEAAVKSPANVHIMYLDPKQIIVNSWDNVWFLQNIAYDYTVSIPYIKNRRDCDGIACIYKAILAYMGYDNVVGLVIDRTMHHAYDAFWWDKKNNGHVWLWAIDPQTGDMWQFNGNHDYTIIW